MGKTNVERELWNGKKKQFLLASSVALIAGLSSLHFSSSSQPSLSNSFQLSSVLNWTTCEEKNLQSDPTCHDVPIIEANESEEFESLRETIVQLNRPVVLSRGPQDAWELRKQVTDLDSFAALLGENATLQNVFRTKEPSILYFNPSMPFAKVSEINWKPPFEHVTLRVEELLNVIQKRNRAKEEDNVKYYFSSEVFSNPELENVAKLVNHTQVQQLAVGPSAGKLHLWLGMNNVTARCHYDTFHNFYLQLVGEKEFVLYPPREWRNLHLFPTLHPSARQSQFDNLALDDETFALRFPHAHYLQSPQVVTLRAGQVLYLPPFWFHRVTSIGPSLSVNVWSVSSDGSLESAIFEDSVPFVSDKRWKDIQVDGAVLHMIQAMASSSSSSSWLLPTLKTVLLSQFNPLRQQGKVNRDISFEGGQECEELRDAMSSVPAELQRIAHAHAAVLMERFMAISPAVRELTLSNFIQGIANWSVGPQRAESHLRCLVAILQ